MIDHKLLENEKILTITPEAALEKTDFEKLSTIVDPYLEKERAMEWLKEVASSQAY